VDSKIDGFLHSDFQRITNLRLSQPLCGGYKLILKTGKDTALLIFQAIILFPVLKFKLIKVSTPAEFTCRSNKAFYLNLQECSDQLFS